MRGMVQPLRSFKEKRVVGGCGEKKKKKKSYGIEQTSSILDFARIRILPDYVGYRRKEMDK